ncbi:MAG: hypothetical protein II969_09695 [Anaerolineaceae bacterium]|nr:hypothetical protein [Anaerolineaceae bacterium]
MFAIKTNENKAAVLDDTINMLHELDLNELEAVRSVINVIVQKEDNFYKPLTETELIARVDKSLALENDGLAMDAEEFGRHIMETYGL